MALRAILVFRLIAFLLLVLLLLLICCASTTQGLILPVTGVVVRQHSNNNRGNNNNSCYSSSSMLRTTRTALEAAHRSRLLSSCRTTGTTLKRRLPTRQWAAAGASSAAGKDRVFATSAPKEADDSSNTVAANHHFDEEIAFKAAAAAATVAPPRAASAAEAKLTALNGSSSGGSSSSGGAGGAFVPKTVARATLNGSSVGTMIRPKSSSSAASDEEYYYHDDHEVMMANNAKDPFATAESSATTTTTTGPSSRDTLNDLMNAAPVEYRSVTDYPSIEAYLEGEGLRSRPVKEGGTWKVEDPLRWTEGFGRRSPQYDVILNDIIHLKPGDEGYFDVNDLKIPGTAIVRTKEQAAIVLEKLMMNAAAAEGAAPIFHACDTEVMDIDLSTVGPVGNGYCTCVSIYSGPDFDYGLGHGPGATLWIDNLDDACGILQEFKDWFEDERFLKVWHNYGFDRHVMWNEGIDVRGFGGDTMHMARLQDSSRARTEGASGNGYGLEALTEDLLSRRKQPMKEIFGIKRLRKDGTEGILVDMPPVEVMQRDPRHRAKWIKYSCYDAEGTWLIRKRLEELLRKMSWINDTNLYDYYWMHMRPFGEVLTDMERRGIRVDANEYLAGVEIKAREDRAHHVEVFRQWAAKKIGADGLALNTASSVQLCTFLFGGAENEKTKEKTESVRVFKVSRAEIQEDALEAYRSQEEAAAKAEASKHDGTYSLAM